MGAGGWSRGSQGPDIRAPQRALDAPLSCSHPGLSGHSKPSQAWPQAAVVPTVATAHTPGAVLMADPVRVTCTVLWGSASDLGVPMLPSLVSAALMS